MVDVDNVLKNTVKKGKVKLGNRQTKIVLKNGSAKLIVLAKNCPYSSEINELAIKSKIPVYNCDYSSIDLGYMCGKTFSVSVFAVIDDGGSNILSLVKKR